MSEKVLIIFEYLVFFSTFIIIFKALNAFDLSRFFKKGHVAQIQILYIVFTVVLSYLFTEAIMNLITLAGNFKY